MLERKGHELQKKAEVVELLSPPQAEVVELLSPPQPDLKIFRSAVSLWIQLTVCFPCPSDVEIRPFAIFSFPRSLFQLC